MLLFLILHYFRANPENFIQIGRTHYIDLCINDFKFHVMIESEIYT